MPPRSAVDAGFLEAKKPKLLSASEVQKHCTENDCWIVVKGKVYDVSKWKSHPGGRVMYTHAGQDATAVFSSFHAGTSYGELDQFYIGDCKETVGVDNEFEREMRGLVGEMHKRGLYNSSKLYYGWKFSFTTAIGLAGIYVALAYQSFASKMGAACLLALFWQQCGWMAHDFAHHAVFRTRWMNDVTVLLVGGFYLGFSLDWWKNKHNTHHAIPNVHESLTDAHDGDPDIDTLPFLAWSSYFLKKLDRKGAVENTRLAHFLVRNQYLVYFPLLLFARATWALQSFAYVFRVSGLYWGSTSKDAVEEQRRKAGPPAAVTSAAAGNVVDVNAVTLRWEIGERLVLLGHWAWFLGLMYATMDAKTAACFVLVSQTMSGLLIALAFGTGHNGMTTFDADKKPGFNELSVKTTRNVNDTVFGLVGWFMGGLHYQVEHHIFPTVPRHNLRAVRALVEPICRKHGVPYHSTSLTRGTIEILQHLKGIASELATGPVM